MATDDAGWYRDALDTGHRNLARLVPANVKQSEARGPRQFDADLAKFDEYAGHCGCLSLKGLG